MRRARLAAILLLAAGCVPAPALEPADLAGLQVLRADASAVLGPQGLELEVRGEETLLLDRAGVRALELELVTDAPLSLLSAAYNGSSRIRAGPPFRTRDLGPGQARVAFDLAQGLDWCPESRALVSLRGTAHVRVSALRVAPAPASADDFGALYDRATRWAPESPGQTTVNFLTPPWWDARRVRALPELLAAAALLVALGAWGLGRLRARPRPGVALTAGVLTAVLGYDLYFAQRMRPTVELLPEPDPAVRLRENVVNAPCIGPLAALARELLAPDARVGVIGSADQWTPRILCYYMAPRRCVRVEPGREVHEGLSGVEHMRLEELDALVVIECDAPLPAGFERVAEVSARSYVARRR